MRDHELDIDGGTRRPPERAEAAADRGGPTAELLRLQRLAGNREVTAMLRQEGERDADHEDASAAGSVAAALEGGGRPLGEELRADMEGRLGHDFSDVRVHTGEAATGSAKALGANAYTVGRDVVFQGDWDPASDAGRRTLAHELTHVVQQAAGPVDGTDSVDGLRVSDPGDRFEQEAERTADAAVGAPAAAGAEAGTAAAAPAVQRQTEGAEEDEEELVAQQSVQRQTEATEEDEEELGA
jgi:Domain of unknown function (DUF4157)